MAGERRAARRARLWSGRSRCRSCSWWRRALFVRTLLASRPPPRLRPGPLLVVDVSASTSRGRPSGRRSTTRLQAAVARCPAFARGPLGDHPRQQQRWNNVVELPGAPALPERRTVLVHERVTPGWFATYGTPILAGRDFDDRDRAGTQPVAIVNEAFARRFLTAPTRWAARSGRGPAGPAMPFMEIVGLVSDAVYRSLRDPVPPTMYVPLAQPDEDGADVVVALNVRAAGGSPALLTARRRRRRRRRSQPGAHRAPARRPGGRVAAAGAARGDAVRLLRRARAAARRARSLRRDRRTP